MAPTRPLNKDFRVSRRTITLCLLAVIVGVLCGFIAVALIKLIGLFTNLFFYHRLSFAFVPDFPNHLGVGVIAVPIIGGLLIGWMARYGSDKIRGHGIPEAMEAVLIGKSRIAPRVALLKPISSAISIGSGGPFGAEGPIIMTGGAVASIFGQYLHLTASERKILLVAGAAGGMAATFAAPVASVLFAVELLAFEMRPRSLVPIAIACAVATVVRSATIGPGPMFPSSASPVLSATGLGIAVVFGLGGGVLAFVLTKAIYAVEDAFHKLPIHWMWWPAIGGLIVGIGGLIVPQALGVGYVTIGALVQGRVLLDLAIGLLLVKSVIWVGALSSGTSGGILAPLLLIGGTMGDAAAQILHFPGHGAWAILGMAATFAGVTRSPLTSIVFLLELTDDTRMLLPLLLACAVATLVSTLILPRSILTEKIARRGMHIARDYTVDPLDATLVRDVMRAVPTASAVPHGVTTILEDETSLAAVNRLVENHEQPLYVIDAAGAWLGVLTATDLLCARKRQHAEETERERMLRLRWPLGRHLPSKEDSAASHSE